jgi:hypothetical protein
MKEKGLVFKDKIAIEKQDKVISYLIKKIGSSLIKGQSIMSISLPVNIFDKRTLLQVLSFEISFAPVYLTRAFYSTTILDRMKWVTTFLISQLHLSPLQFKPFSPILGETFQCKIGDMDIYVEQTVSKPLVSNFYMTTKSGLYKIYGHISTDASTGANSVKAKKTGMFTVEFKDDQKYNLYFPSVNIHGTTMGKRLFNYKNYALVCDEKNNLASFIHFHPDEKGAIMSMFKKQTTFPDNFKYNII